MQQATNNSCIVSQTNEQTKKGEKKEKKPTITHTYNDQTNALARCLMICEWQQLKKLNQSTTNKKNAAHNFMCIMKLGSDILSHFEQ